MGDDQEEEEDGDLGSLLAQLSRNQNPQPEEVIVPATTHAVPDLSQYEALEEAEPDDSLLPAELESYDVGIVDSTWQYLTESDGYKNLMSEAQLAILTGMVPLELTKKRPLNKAETSWHVYIDHWTVRQILNRAFLFKWKIIREDFKTIEDPVTLKKEAFVWGRMEIDAEFGKIVIPFFSGHKIVNNPNITQADAFESALSHAIRKCGEGLGIGSVLKGGKGKQRALVYHGVAYKPSNSDLNKLRVACDAATQKEAIEKLGAEMWELKSEERVQQLTLEAKRRWS